VVSIWLLVGNVSKAPHSELLPSQQRHRQHHHHQHVQHDSALLPRAATSLIAMLALIPTLPFKTPGNATRVTPSVWYIRDAETGKYAIALSFRDCPMD